MQVQTIIINKTTWGRVKNNLYATKSSCWTKLYRRTPSVTHQDNVLNLNPDRCITIQDFLDPRSRWRDLRTKQLPETCCDTCHPSDNIRRVSSETEQPSEPRSEERRVGKEGRGRRWTEEYEKNEKSRKTRVTRV